MTGVVHAGAIDVGNPDLEVRWDTTVEYSAAWRIKGVNPALVADPVTHVPYVNADDGDRNFGKGGLISNRVGLFSEMDLVWDRRLGGRVSAAAFYDDVYNHQRNDNPGFAGGAFPNQTSVPYNQFTKATQSVNGRNAELLDAFVFGNADLGDTKVSARLGRYSMIWGESLFFGSNAIAGGMTPVDLVKLQSVPGTQFKEIIRPVPQASLQAQLTPEISVGAYYQFRWDKTRASGAGSYFSTFDAVVDGGENLLVPGRAPNSLTTAPRSYDRDPKKSGQGGLQMRVRALDTDFGLYAIRYDSKTPQVVTLVKLVQLAPNGPPTAIPVGYYQAYNQGITALGLSANRSFDIYNVAFEASVRNNQDLASPRAIDLSPTTGVASNVSDNPGYAVGRTAHVNISLISTLERSLLWNEATLTAEFAWTRLLSVTKSAAALDPNGTRDGTEVRFRFEPTYRQVLPQFDLSVPIGISWAPKNARPLSAGTPLAWTPANGGDMSIGLNGSYRDAWRFTLNYTHFYGAAQPTTVGNPPAYTWKQPLADRDFVSASVRYSF